MFVHPIPHVHVSSGGISVRASDPGRTMIHLLTMRHHRHIKDRAYLDRSNAQYGRETEADV